MSERELSNVLLLPGLLCDAAVWGETIEVLAARANCTVPSFDGFHDLVDMAAEALAAAPSGPLSIVGHSMGGRVALEMTRLAPHRVARLALLDTGCEPMAAADAERERSSRYALLAIARREGMRAMALRWARPMVHPDRLGDPVFDDILAMVERRTPHVFEGQIEALLARPDATGVLQQLRCPVLFMCGREDTWSPLERHERMHAMVPGSKLVVVEHAGHMAPMERPRAVARGLLEWLRTSA